MVEHLDKVFQTIERWIRRHVTALFLAACGMLWLALRFPGNTHAMAVAMPRVRENDTPGVLRECSGRLRSYYRQNVTQIWTVYHWTYYIFNIFLSMNLWRWTPLQVWSFFFPFGFVFVPVQPVRLTELNLAISHSPPAKHESSVLMLLQASTHSTHSTPILHHVSVQSGCEGSIFGRSRPEGKTTWGGRDSLRHALASKDGRTKTTMTVEYSGATETEVGLEVTWSHLKWLKRPKSSVSHEDYRRLVLCPGGETEGRGSDVSTCTVHRFRPCKRKNMMMFRRVSVDGVEWLYR